MDIKRMRDGVTCVLFVRPVLPIRCYPYLVSAVFVTAIHTSSTLLENVCYTCVY